MPSVLAPVTYEPIKAVRTLASGPATPNMERHPEAATLTIMQGVPLMLDGSGNVVEFSSAAANIVYGVSAEPGHNLTTAGTAKQLSEAAPINQPSGVTTPIGAWIRDGRMGLYQANGLTIFSIVLKAGQVFTQALMIAGTLYGITKDATTGLWFLDNTVTGGNSGVAVIVGPDGPPASLNPSTGISSPNTAAGGERVFIQFASSKRYFQ